MQARWVGLMSLAFTVLADASVAADSVSPGKLVFDRFCAECHAPGFGHPGAQRLATLRGEKLSILENRRDLLPAYVVLVVRQGLVEMPPYRATEINDAQLAQVASYLGRAVTSRRR